MPIYAVIIPSDSSVSVEESVEQKNRCRIGVGAWLVRSEHLTSGEVAESLGVSIGKSGVVIASKGLGGVANRDVIEKINAWEQGNG